MYLSYEQVEADDTVKTISALTVPTGAAGAELQAETQDIRYTMDLTANPTEAHGMVLSATAPQPVKQFSVEDIQRIRFIRGAAVNATLHVHWFGGRDDL